MSIDKVLKELDPSTIKSIITLTYSVRQRIKKLSVFEKNPELTLPQCFILKYLALNKDKAIYHKDIVEELGIRRSSVTGIVNSMEKNGYVHHESEIKDARFRKVSETELGASLVSHIDAGLMNLNYQLESGISKEDMIVFKSVIEKMKRNLMK